MRCRTLLWAWPLDAFAERACVCVFAALCVDWLIVCIVLCCIAIANEIVIPMYCCVFCVCAFVFVCVCWLLGSARLGSARLGSARLGLFVGWLVGCLVLLGFAWFGSVRFGLVFAEDDCRMIFG